MVRVATRKSLVCPHHTLYRNSVREPLAWVWKHLRGRGQGSGTGLPSPGLGTEPVLCAGHGFQLPGGGGGVSALLCTCLGATTPPRAPASTAAGPRGKGAAGREARAVCIHKRGSSESPPALGPAGTHRAAIKRIQGQRGVVLGSLVWRWPPSLWSQNTHPQCNGACSAKRKAGSQTWGTLLVPEIPKPGTDGPELQRPTATGFRPWMAF